MIETLVVTLSALGAVVLLYVWSRQRSQRLTARERLATANLSAGLSTQTFAAPAVPETPLARALNFKIEEELQKSVLRSSMDHVKSR